ncbi:hypothetical protein CCYA_CCYA13G3556 [Cyanidiococcus yangmingshanensis]|uniref:Helix-turn-helix domain-containing protein n=1 Tax=Cyanidiococcus yangmingshanensis TaxID=2690220 RepID=A0A7J7IFH8_9RHOD|nr:hypothetical protein F1559_001675 [Cyanidiococcus yangmingshanensis]KAK4532699.1 hypothetical protein CCYA_CCYA13G3556 [Cyanidiococcus yangmingshanensis]
MDGEETELYIGGPVEADGHLGMERHVHDQGRTSPDLMLGADLKESGSITVARAAEIFAVCPKTIRRWCDAGKLEHFRTPGGHRRIRTSSVLEIQQRTSHPKKEELQ